MIEAKPGARFAAQVVSFPTGLTGTVGVRIRSLSGVDVVDRTTVSVTELSDQPGSYIATLTAPLINGTYAVFWDWDPLELRSSRTAQEPLTVSGVAQPLQTSQAPVAGYPLVPHFAMPFQLGPAGAKVTEQDSLDEVRDCVANVCAYRIGDRPEKPAFGIPDQTFSLGGPDPHLLIATIAAQEPRASLSAAVDITDLEDLVANVDLTATLNVNVDLKGGT